MTIGVESVSFSPPTSTTILPSGAILCRYGDGRGDYRVDCGEVLLTSELADQAVKLGWRNLGSKNDAERERNRVRVHRTNETALVYFVRAADTPFTPDELTLDSRGKIVPMSERQRYAQAILAVLQKPVGLETLDWEIADAVLALVEYKA